MNKQLETTLDQLRDLGFSITCNMQIEFANGMIENWRFQHPDYDYTAALLFVAYKDGGFDYYLPGTEMDIPAVVANIESFFKDRKLSKVIDEAIKENDVMKLREMVENLGNEPIGTHRAKVIEEMHVKEPRQPTLRERLIAECGVPENEIHHYCSDLQVLYTKERMDWLKENYEHYSIIKVYTGDVKESDWYNKRFIEIPFAFIEYHWSKDLRDALNKSLRKAHD